MIFTELLYLFRNNLEIEYIKRKVPERDKFKLNQKQVKVIFTKVLSDLQKEFHIVESDLIIQTIAGEASYALTRDYMIMKDVYYEAKRLNRKPMKYIYDAPASNSYPLYYSVRWKTGYPYLIVSPTPTESNKTIIAKSYNDIKLYSVNDGIDGKAQDPADDTLYMRIPTKYDVAIILGMMAELYDDRIPLYEKEKLRLRSMREVPEGLTYNMTGVIDEFTKTDYNYNSDADATPSVLPPDPT